MLAAVRPLQTRILKIFIEEIFAYYRNKSGAAFEAPCGAISVTQRFGASLNLHLHFHVLAFDGVYHRKDDGLSFEDVPSPTQEELRFVSGRVADRVFGHLIRNRMWDAAAHTFDIEPPEWIGPDRTSQYGWLLSDGDVVGADPSFSLPPKASSAEVQGFSVHAGVTVDAHDVDGRERLCRYVTRPAFASEQVTETKDGRIAFQLPKPRRSGETHVFFTPLEFIRKVTFQIPPLGQNLVRYHGVLAPAARERS